KLSQEESQKRIDAIVETADSGSSPQNGKGVNKDKLRQMIKQLYLETARLPENEAAKRVAEVTGQVLALHIVENDEKAKNRKLTPDEIGEALAAPEQKIDELHRCRVEFVYTPAYSTESVLQVTVA